MRKEEVSKNDDHTLSVIYANLKTVKDCLPDVKAERPTIGIEYHLQLINGQFPFSNLNLYDQGK